MRVVCYLLTAYWFILFARIILSWFPMPMYSTWFSRIHGIIYSLTEPVMRPFRNLLPPVRFGAVALDLSPIILFIVLAIVRSYVCRFV
jgi:YggT family protein